MRKTVWIILFFISIIIHHTLAQPNKKYFPATVKTGYVFSKAKNTYVKAVEIGAITSASTRIATFSPPEEIKIVTTMGDKVWYLPTSTRSGSWVTPPNIKQLREERAKKIADYTYPISIEGYNNYPYRGKDHRGVPLPSAPLKPFNINSISENSERLSREEVVSDGFIGTGKTNVYYVKKLRLGMISFGADQDHIIVTDTLYVSTAMPFQTSLVAISQSSRPYVKIITNCIIYESPINLGLTGAKEADFVFAAEKILFKCPYKNLQDYELKPAPPLFRVAGMPNYIYRDYINGENEQKLLFRLYVNIMKQALEELNSTADIWRKDKLVEEFQKYRYTRIKQEIKVKDPVYSTKFNKLCNDFDTKYSNYVIEPVRELNGIVILTSGNIKDIASKPLKYAALPSKAQLIPKFADTTQLLGSILYNTVGDAKFKLLIDIDLLHTLEKFKQIQNELNTKGLKLDEKLPVKIVSIEEQPLKIKGKTMGRILPISNQSIRLEVNLPEETKTLIELFPKVGTISFKLDFTVEGMNQKYSQDYQLEIDKDLIRKLNYNKPLESFEVLESSNLSEEVKLSSVLDATLKEEGVLNYAEVILEIQFDNAILLRGPYRLSSYNTLASETVIPFLKKSKDYTITISGRALYDNGERSFVPFATKDKIIVIDEAVFKSR